jgi:hypothetical protein
MRLPVFAAAFILLAGVAQAQNPLTGTTGPLASPNPGPAASAAPGPAAAAPPHRTRRTLQDRFDEANVTHDGHLTMEQARAKMPAVARDFTAIDKDHKGYVTVADIQDYRRAKAAERRAERRAAKTPAQ